MGETDPEGLADRLEDEAHDLEHRNQELGQQTEDVAQEWERKRSDPAVPGAPPPVEDEDRAPPTGAPTGKGDDQDGA